MRDGGHPAAFIHARCGPERAAVLLTVERTGWLDFHLLCTVQAIPGMMRLLQLRRAVPRQATDTSRT